MLSYKKVIGKCHLFKDSSRSEITERSTTHTGTEVLKQDDNWKKSRRRNRFLYTYLTGMVPRNCFKVCPNLLHPQTQILNYGNDMNFPTFPNTSSLLGEYRMDG